MRIIVSKGMCVVCMSWCHVRVVCVSWCDLLGVTCIMLQCSSCACSSDTGYVDDITGVVSLHDTFSTSHLQPVDDTHQDIITFSGTQVNGVTSISFRRRLDTGDKLQDVTITDSMIYVHWAVAPMDDLTLIHDRWGVEYVNLMTGSVMSVTVTSSLNAAVLLCLIMTALFVAYALLRVVRRCTKHIRHHTHIATLKKQSSTSHIHTALTSQVSMSSLNHSPKNAMRGHAATLAAYHDQLSGGIHPYSITVAEADAEAEERSFTPNPVASGAWDDGNNTHLTVSSSGMKHRRINTTITAAVVQPASEQTQRWEQQWVLLQTEEGWNYFFNEMTQGEAGA